MVLNQFLVCFIANASQCYSVILMIFFDNHHVSVDGIVWSILLQMSLSLDLYIFLLSLFRFHLTIHYPPLVIDHC